MSLRITWYSNAPWAPTGYGTQTAQVVRRLKATGHEVAIANNYGLTAAATDWEGCAVLPSGQDLYSNDLLRAHHDFAWGGDPRAWVLTLYDVWVLQPLPQARVACWVPVDHSPAPPRVAEWFRQESGPLPIAMSRFGQQALMDSGVEARYVPHAIETTQFRPTPTLPDGSATRAALGIADDAYVVMVNAANKGNSPPRKAWSEMLTAFSIFAREHSDAVLFLHTDIRNTGGVDLPILLAALDLGQDRVKWVDQYAYRAGMIDAETLAAYYTASDVLLATSMGEGFGIPVVEAQACGTPVIVTRFSAQPELVGAGWTVGYQPAWDPHQASFLATPYVGEIVARLRDAYAARGDEELMQSAVAKGLEYDADRVFREFWLPVLEEMDAEPKRNLAIKPKKGPVKKVSSKPFRGIATSRNTSRFGRDVNDRKSRGYGT